MAGLPDACAASSVVRRRSYISADGTLLDCDVVDERRPGLSVERAAGAGARAADGDGHR